MHRTMNRKIRHLIKRIIPLHYFNMLLTAVKKKSLQATKIIFANAPGTPEWLDMLELEKLQQKFSYPSEYGYDPISIEMRGRERAAGMLKLVPSAVKNILELGCWDGMVSCALQRKGKNATAIDYRSEGFDKRAQLEGVNLLKMDASRLQFDNESFDLVFSYDSFEHFAAPEAVMKEAVRVARKGGYIFLEFGPLYMSPLGMHAYRQITVPYCQFLFPREVLNQFLVLKGMDQIDFTQCNGWTLTRFRNLWKSFSGELDVIHYREIPDYSHLQLIRTYPSCFKSKTEYFDDLIISNIQIVLKKK